MVRRRPYVLLALALLLVAPSLRAGGLYDRDDGREAALLGAGAAVGAGGLWVGSQLAPLSPEELARLDTAGLPGVDRAATLLWSPTAAVASDVLAYGSLAAPLLFLVDAGPGADEGDLAMMYAQTVLLEHGTVGLIKGLVRRPRPLAYNPDPRIPDALRRSRHAVRSFPSGHTASAFAAAMFAGEVYARLHPDDPARHWVRYGGLTVAAATGWLRVRAGRHFPTDVLAGAVIGSLIGWAVPRLHEVDAADGAGGGRAAPGPGLMLGFGF